MGATEEQDRIVEWIEGTGGEEDHRDLYLDELVDFIAMAFGRLVTERCAFSLLRRMGYFRKKLRIHASQRCEMERGDYADHIERAGYSADQYVFVDETASNTRDWKRWFGYAIRCADALWCRLLWNRNSGAPRTPTHRLRCPRRAIDA